ncbi:MAG: transcription-repair coupling factor [Ruminococcus sp.]|nr:transcription-repair coupling factor [Ruminococcus sp.]
MNIFYEISSKLPAFKEIKKCLLGGYTPCCVTGVSHIHKAQLSMALSTLSSCLVICQDEASCTRMAEDINSMAQQRIACVYPAKDLNFAYMEGISREYEHKRLEALSLLLQGKCSIICASIEACLQGTIPRSTLKEHSFEISTGSEIQLDELVKKLLAGGYTRTQQIEGQAQFSVRGSIVDIFPVQEEHPVRLELWGDEVDTLSYFDTVTQRRTQPLDSITVFPALEIIFESTDVLTEKLSSLSKAARGKKIDSIRKNISRDIEIAQAGITLTNLDKYYSLAYEQTATVFDYFDGGAAVVCEYSNCIEKGKAALSQLSEDIKLLYEDGILFKRLEGFFIDLPSAQSKLLSMRSVFLDTFMRSNNDIKFKKLINSDQRQTSAWGGNIVHLEEELHTLCDDGYCTVVLAGSEKTVPIIVKDLIEAGISAQALSENSRIIPGIVYVRTGSLSGGFDLPEIKCAAITQMKAMSAKRKRRSKKPGEEIKSLSDIKSGDIVVHSMYGIGRFDGIKSIETGGITKDYITIKYAGTDVLYVPVTQLDLVSKYIGAGDDDKIKLNKLNSAEWTKTRNRVKAAVKDMAEQLTKLYAQRQLAKGFAFSPDNEWQAEFEERFDYDETEDQLRSIEEIKADMQKPSPMDRLLCGDVGFGKTEVALRAAFKAILDGKQVAVLVPTTVLAWQHYQTAIKRFEHFPVKVELLSRFRKPKEQKAVIRELGRGTVDIVIGTHRLVQKDVVFKDLGLAIVDEEQRFGVAAKEKFKELFKGVDVLTLSATPIPRTLNMALSGIRDMSVINEAPMDRHPVQTYVIEYNIGVIAQAISKELRRGGQVYYIHNRIDSIERTVAKLHELLPDARIGVAHGRIDEDELSEIWRQLVDREIDVLVCTTLIETGVDVPNVNTLIIENADRMGLSQLYQLRGRVGRSSRRAFAYFTFTRGKVLSEVASKRLDAIREFTQFGSGFHIALRDLEIRGAGSVLSGKQHGHMEAVGYDMYIRLLNEAIAEQKGEAPPPSPEDCLVDISIDAYIPESYIQSSSQRIDAYRKIASVNNSEDSRDVIDELIDRYGEPPKAVMGLINVALTRNRASLMHITEIVQRGDKVLFFITCPEICHIQALSKFYKNRIRFVDSGKQHFAVTLDKKQQPHALMLEVIDIMEKSQQKEG